MNARSTLTNGLVTSKILATRTGFLSLGAVLLKNSVTFEPEKSPLLDLLSTDQLSFDVLRGEVRPHAEPKRGRHVESGFNTPMFPYLHSLFFLF